MSTPVCPTDCNGLPEVLFNECAPDLHYGEISKIYFTTANADDFTDVEDLAEWQARLADSGGDEDSIRTLGVIGELVAPEGTEIRINGNRRIMPPKTYKLNFTIYETNDTNYDLVRAFECNIKSKIWFETSDGMLYGGKTGILGTFKIDSVIPLNYQELHTFPGVFTWENNMLPDRCVSPMA
jgi:hypothetical protein